MNATNEWNFFFSVETKCPQVKMIRQLDFIGMKGNGWHLIQRFYIKFKEVLKGYGCSRWDSNTIFFLVS